jgi:hypothetical protein
MAPTPSIVTTPQPIAGNVLIQINYAASGADFARVRRLEVDGTLTTIRPNTSSDTSGQYIELSAGLATFYDTEAPLDVSLFYVTDDITGAYTATSSEVILQSGGDLWLRDPLLPFNNLRINGTVTPGLPECQPGMGIYLLPMDNENRATATTLTQVNNRSTPIPLVRPRASATSALNLVTRTFDDRDMVTDINAAGTTLLLDTPPKFGYARRYISVSDVTTTRVSRDQRRQWSTIAMPYAVVDAPAGLAYGTLGTRWADLCARYITFGAMTAAGVTWQQVLLGAAGPTSAGAVSLRTWAQVNSDFASWSAYNSGGRTWESGLEGN